MEDKEQQIRNELSRDILYLGKNGSFMFDNIDSFVALSRDNTRVTEVVLYPYEYDDEAGNYEFWDKVGEIMGNLMELNVIMIHFLPYNDFFGDGVTIRRPDWEIITRILPFVWREVALNQYAYFDVEVEDIQGLARAIHGHPKISKFDSLLGFTFENMGPWCSALATLPSLKGVVFGLKEPETEDQRALLNVEPLKELLRAPALRIVAFKGFYFTNEVCHATADALQEGSSIIAITFDNQCTFPDGGRAIIANALKTNLTVTSVQFHGDCDEHLCDTLAVVLLCNSTLQDLALQLPEEGAGGRWLSPIFLSLAMNISLKSLTANIRDEFGDELCAAISNGLAKNSTLEALVLDDMITSDSDNGVSARNALSFLRTNSTLRSLTVSFVRAQNESYVSAFRLEAVGMMENTCLENLTIKESSGSDITVEELLTLISALQLNTTLKTLEFHSSCFENGYFSVDEVNQLVSILKKNYGLEHLLPDIPCADGGRVKAILRLNAAGRRYLIEDGSSISKGVDVLSAVSDEIDCVFLHLLENPSLCDRRATDTTAARQRPGINVDESSSTGKRERALSLPGKEPRRRLA
jgi:hypothetical protein